MFFSNAYGSFSRTEHVLGHKRGLNKFKETEIASDISSDHKGMNQKSIIGKVENPQICGD